jgi:hypothetical protein
MQFFTTASTKRNGSKIDSQTSIKTQFAATGFQVKPTLTPSGSNNVPPFGQSQVFMRTAFRKRGYVSIHLALALIC